VEGLAKLEEIEVDLILLDVTMPNMDGPTMLAKLRESGNKTPVIMLTSESKRQIVSGAVKLGIEDYILKPFKPDELRGKVLKVLKLEARGSSAPVPAATPSAAPPPAPGGAGDGQRQFVDVLLIDDMENVHKKFRTLLPPHVAMNACVSAREALQMCQERNYRIVLVDLVIPDVNSVALMNQLRALQPQAVMLALALRSPNDISAEVKGQGFHDVMFKPFDVAAVGEFMSRHFETSEEVTVDGNVLQCATFEGKDDRLDRYFARVKTLCRDSLEKLASACFEDSILDLGFVPLKNSEKVVRMVMEIDKEAKKLGLALRIVGTPDVKHVMSSITETAELPFYGTVSEARSAAA
jgi:DNA-binding response OmpR family regulator